MSDNLVLTYGTVILTEPLIVEPFNISPDDKMEGIQPTTFTSKSPQDFSSFMSQFFQQIRLLLWKRNLELKNQKYERMKYIFPPLLSFILLLLMYNAYNIFNKGTLEVLFISIRFPPPPPSFHLKPI